jgi:CheY-like chemotaxis protein
MATMILLAEDTNRNVSAQQLRRCGYEVLEAASGARALELLEQNPIK